MIKEIILKSVGGYHFGKMVDLSKYTDCYFKSNDIDESNDIHKAIILSIFYQADEIYNKTDGYAGNCWKAVINDSRLINNEHTYTLIFRNFSDIVNYYDSQNMGFFKKNTMYNQTTYFK